MENQTVLAALSERFPRAVLASGEFRGDLSVTVRREDLIEVVQFLRNDSALGYIYLENLCAVDYLGRTPRFEVVIHLTSLQHAHRICLKVGAPADDPRVPSLTGLFATANYQEREAYDLMGVIFEGHPSLTRILMPDDWVGHPQRKDHPLGDEEVAFTFNQDRIYAQKPFAKE